MLRAESGLDPHAERWGTLTHTARQCLANQDWVCLRSICASQRTDISFGLCQMTVGTAGGYQIGDGSAVLDNVLAVRTALFDRAVAIDVGAQHLAGCCHEAAELEVPGWDPALVALTIYNAGSWMDPASEPEWWENWSGNVSRYRECLAWARKIVEGG